MPCMLVINWSEVEDSEKARDLIDMVSVASIPQ